MFPSLFEPGSIGTMTLKNRLIMPPISTNLAGQYGTVSEELVCHYAAHGIPADRVVWAREPGPADELAQAIQDLAPIVIGDAAAPRKIIDAIAAGHMAARRI